MMGFVAFVEKKRTSLLLLALFLVLFGSRAALLSYAANSTPFFDEWDGDAFLLLQPYLQGRLGIADLLAPYNEHRIVFTRLLVLSIFQASGYWDVVLQMIVNAILDSVTVVAVGYSLVRVLSGGLGVAAMIVCVTINAVPYAYDNVLLGFNTHFYLLISLSFASLWLMAGAAAWSARWVLGALAALGSYFCMASGALTLATVCALHLLQAVLGRRVGYREATGIAALAALTTVLLALIPHVEASDAFRAHSLGEYLSAFIQLLSWPANFALGMALYVPSAIFLVRTLADRPNSDDPRWINVGALVWVLGAIAALAEGRAQWPMQSRYVDILLIGSMINLVSALWLWTRRAAGKRSIVRRVALGVWMGLFVLSLIHPQRHVRDRIDERRAIAIAEAKNLRGYLATGDASFLGGAPALQIPYFDSGHLRYLLDTPEIRAALPPDLTGKPPPHPWVEAVKQTVLGSAPIWLGIGVLLLTLVVASATATTPPPPPLRQIPEGLSDELS
jgi:hypothetical protein